MSDMDDRLTKAEEILEESNGLEWCDKCEEYTETEIVTVNGRVGHIDDWLPDDHIGYCLECGSER